MEEKESCPNGLKYVCFLKKQRPLARLPKRSLAFIRALLNLRPYNHLTACESVLKKE